MSPDLKGQLYSLAAAVTWAAALVLFKTSGERVAPIPLNLFKNCVGLALFGATIVATSEWTALPQDRTTRDFVILAISGVLGIALADTLFFYGLNLCGVGLISIVDCLYTPFVMLFSWWLIGEDITPLKLCGAGLILAGVFVCTGHKPPASQTRQQLLLGMLYGAGAFAMMAFGIVLAKPVLERYPVNLASAIRLLAGTAALALTAVMLPGRGELLHVFRPSRVWLVALPASALGTYVSLAFWVAGFKYTNASVAAMLNQTTLIFAIVLAAVFLKERLTPRILVAVVLALGGVLLVTQGGRWFGTGSAAQA
jgi:drug/metabolite transporter (DMT)-like permease